MKAVRFLPQDSSISYFTWIDIYDKRPAVVVSKSFVSEYWHRPQDALGQRIRVGITDTWREIVGVSEDVHYDGVEKPASSMVYRPLMMAYFTGQQIKLQHATVWWSGVNLQVRNL